jgi:hypothetical protein
LENLIREVVELDKLKRLELKKLEDEKTQLGSFFREERKRLEKEYKEEAKKIFNARKKEIDNSIHDAQIKSKADYEKKLNELEKAYKDNKDTWIDDLYEYCIEIENKE